MLAMLINAGLDPNLFNAEGNTLVHVATMLGYFDCLQLLYETKRCLLILKNTANQTALDIAHSQPDKAVLHVLKYFAEYHDGEPSEWEQLEAIAAGRRLCANYITDKLLHDRQQEVQNMVQSTLDANNERRRKARILRGVGGTKYTSFYADLSYHTDIRQPHWDKVNMDFFLQYYEGIDHIVRTIFACDYVNKSIRVGMHNVLTRLAVKQPVSTFPVPTAEARIPGVVVAPTAVSSAVRTGITMLTPGAGMASRINVLPTLPSSAPPTDPATEERVEVEVAVAPPSSGVRSESRREIVVARPTGASSGMLPALVAPLSESSNRAALAGSIASGKMVSQRQSSMPAINPETSEPRRNMLLPSRGPSYRAKPAQPP